MAKIIGNTTSATNPRPDWNQTDETKSDFIKNKPNLDLYATMEWVKAYVASMIASNYTVVENESGGITYNVTSEKYSVEENDSGGNTVII